MPSPVGGSPSEVAVLSQTVQLTDAQIKALPTTPVVIIAAAGAGKAIIPFAFNFKLNNTAGAYENVANAAWQLFAQGEAGALTAIRKVSGILNVEGEFPRGVSGSEMSVGTGSFEGSVITDTGNTAENTAIVLSDAWNGSNYTEGHADNTLTVTVLYSLIDV